MQTRDRLHRLIDELPDAELPAVERFLSRRGDARPARALAKAPDDPFLRALADAPEDDEPLTPEDEAAIREGLEAIERGDLLSQAEVRRELGL